MAVKKKAKKPTAAQQQAARDKVLAQQRTASIAKGADADAELQYGGTRNYLSTMLSEAPSRYASISQVYDGLASRVTDIARARSEGAGQAIAHLASGYADMGSASAGADAGAQNDLAAKGFTGDAATKMASDRMGAAGQNREAVTAAAVGGQANTDNLYSMAGQAELQKGQDIYQRRVDDAELRGSMMQTLTDMANTRVKSTADRTSAYATSDAATRTAEAAQAAVDQAEAASVRSNQTKRDVSLMIALEKFGLAPVYAKEKGVQASVDPGIITALMKLAGHKAGKGKAKPKAPAAKHKTKTAAKHVVKKKAAVKPPVKHRTAGARAAA